MAAVRLLFLRRHAAELRNFGRLLKPRGLGDVILMSLSHTNWAVRAEPTAPPNLAKNEKKEKLNSQNANTRKSFYWLSKALN